jgi:hypothetical protein
MSPLPIVCKVPVLHSFSKVFDLINSFYVLYVEA